MFHELEAGHRKDLQTVRHVVTRIQMSFEHGHCVIETKARGKAKGRGPAALEL